MTTGTPEELDSRGLLTELPPDEDRSLTHPEQSEKQARTMPGSSLAEQASMAEPAPSRAAEDDVDRRSAHAPTQEATAAQSNDQHTSLRQGQVYEAVVDTVHQDAVLVHLPDSQREGFAPARDLRHLDADSRATLEEGDHIPVRVLKDPGSPGDVIVSLDQETTGQNRSRHQDWARAEELLRNSQTFKAQVTGFNRGGVLVSFGQLEGFVPNSHLERVGSRDREAKANLVRQTLSLVVLEVDRPKRRLILSQRAARKHNREQILSELEKGQVRTGIVRNLVDFGAFVDLGGVDGLIHISELDWQHVDHPSDVLRVGDEVEVYVLDVDRDRSRISLSRKYLLPRPWDEVAPTPEDENPVAGTAADDASQHSEAR